MLKMKKKICREGDWRFETKKGVGVNESVMWKGEWSGFISENKQWWKANKNAEKMGGYVRDLNLILRNVKPYVSR